MLYLCIQYCTRTYVSYVHTAVDYYMIIMSTGPKFAVRFEMANFCLAEMTRLEMNYKFIEAFIKIYKMFT